MWLTGLPKLHSQFAPIVFHATPENVRISGNVWDNNFPGYARQEADLLMEIMINHRPGSDVMMKNILMEMTEELILKFNVLVIIQKAADGCGEMINPEDALKRQLVRNLKILFGADILIQNMLGKEKNNLAFKTPCKNGTFFTPLFYTKNFTFLKRKNISSFYTKNFAFFIRKNVFSTSIFTPTSLPFLQQFLFYTNCFSYTKMFALFTPKFLLFLLQNFCFFYTKVLGCIFLYYTGTYNTIAAGD